MGPRNNLIAVKEEGCGEAGRRGAVITPLNEHRKHLTLIKRQEFCGLEWSSLRSFEVVETFCVKSVNRESTLFLIWKYTSQRHICGSVRSRLSNYQIIYKIGYHSEGSNVWPARPNGAITNTNTVVTTANHDMIRCYLGKEVCSS